MRSLLDFIPTKTLVESNSHVHSIEKTLGLRASSNLPVQPIEAKWSVLDDPQRLGRKFRFKDLRTQKAFIAQLIDYQEDVSHHAKITIENKVVIIETFTHGVNEVTELDQELAKFADELYEDVLYYFITNGQIK